MIKKIKKFLTDRGWYNIRKETRHFMVGMFLVFLFAGIMQMFTMPISWPLAGLATLGFVVVKELLIDKVSDVRLLVKELVWYVLGIVAGMFPYYIGI
jgi:hypothetical protein